MNEHEYESALSSGLASTLCLLLAIPLVGMGVLWTISPLIAGIAGAGILAIYIKFIRLAMKALAEIYLANI